MKEIITISENEETTVEVFEAEELEVTSVDSEVAFPALGEDNVELNHALLYGRDSEDQHPIEAITGLRGELNEIERLKTVYSDKKQQANYYIWHDENPLWENREGLFVSMHKADENDVLHNALCCIEVCNGQQDVFGVTVAEAGFIGGQEYVNQYDDVKIGRDLSYGLVVHSGIVGVRCETTVSVGDYVVPNIRGEAKKSEGDYGYVVTALSQVSGVIYAIISLTPSSVLEKIIADNVEDLGGRMRTAEYNIASVTNVANSAYALAIDAKENAKVSSEYIEEKVEEVLGRMDAVDGVVGNLSESVSNADANATMARAVAESAVNSAYEIRKETIEEINKTNANINDLIDKYEPLNTWVDEETGKISKEYIIKDLDDNGLATKSEIMTVDSKTEEAFTAIQHNAKVIQSLASKIDKYAAGEYSQAYGLTFEQAQSILEEGYVYVPNIVHSETYDADEPYKQEFLLGYYYTWNSEGWVSSESTAVSFSSEYFGGTELTPYWIVTISDVMHNEVTYEIGGLYHWEQVDGVWSWVKVASVDDNALSRAISSVEQKADSISAEVTSLSGNYSGLELRLENTEAVVESSAQWAKGTSEDGEELYNLATIKQAASGDGSSLSLVVADIEGNKVLEGASIVLGQDSEDSYIQFDADRINFVSQKFNIYPSDGNGNITSGDPNFSVGTDGNVSIKGRVDADSGMIGGCEIKEDKFIGGVIQSKDYKNILLWGEDFGNNQDKSEGLSFELMPNGTYEVSGIGTCTDDNIIIPETYNGKAVTSIGNTAFQRCNFSNIVIPESVMYIGSNTFNSCINLKNVSIPNSVISIYSTTFSGCDNLQYNEYDNALYLGNDENKYLVLMKTISKDISSCVININTKIIVKNAFNSCDSLTSITIPDSVEYIKTNAILFCFNLQYNEYDNGLYLGNDNNKYVVLVKASSKDISSCIIHNNTKFIYEGAFSSCTNLTNITIPDSVTSIGEWAFKNCSNLTNITLPVSVTHIDEEVFCDCTSLTSVTIPDSVTSISDRVFMGSGLTNVTIPTSVTSIGNGAFKNSSLINITIPDSVTVIYPGAFSGCSNLTSINIPDFVTFIGSSVFRDCTSLTSITIPDSVTFIGYDAFSGCTNLKVYCEAYEKPTNWDSDWSSTGPDVYWYSENEPTGTGNYWHYGSGMNINLDYATFDSPKFKIDANGDATFKGEINGGIIKSAKYNQNSGLKIDLDNATFDSPKFKINSNGSATFSGDLSAAGGTFKGTINGGAIQSVGYQQDVKGLRINLDDSTFDSPIFKIYENGTAKFSGFTVEETGLYNGINSFSSTGDGVYLGTDGLNIGGNFTVSKNGYVSVLSGKVDIGKIESDYLNATTIEENLIKLGYSYENYYNANLFLTGSKICMINEDYVSSDSPFERRLEISPGVSDSFGGYSNQDFYISASANPPDDYIYRYAGLFLESINPSYSLGSNIHLYCYKSSTDSYPKGYINFSAEGGGTFSRGTWVNDSGLATISDQNYKHEISLLDEKYDVLFDYLTPKKYKYNNGTSNRFHVGLISQEVSQAILKAGLTEKEFAGIITKEILDEETKDVKTFDALRYEEFIALCIDQIQKLKTKVSELEDKLNTQQND